MNLIQPIRSFTTALIAALTISVKFLILGLVLSPNLAYSFQNARNSPRMRAPQISAGEAEMNQILNSTQLQGYCGQIARLDSTSIKNIERTHIHLTANRKPANSSSLLIDQFYYKNGKFSENRRTADAYTHPSWLRMSLLSRANTAYQNYIRLLDAHNARDTFNPATLVCKTVVESCLRPQDDAPGRRSTAAGLSQATKTTINGFFRTSPWFRSKVKGFENIRDGRTYRTHMPKSILAQQEIGWAIMVMKAKELRTFNEKKVLEFYLGSKSRSANSAYANRILRCSECIQQNGNTISMRCLNRARSTCAVPGARD